MFIISFSFIISILLIHLFIFSLYADYFIYSCIISLNLSVYILVNLLLFNILYDIEVVWIISAATVVTAAMVSVPQAFPPPVHLGYLFYQLLSLHL